MNNKEINEMSVGIITPYRAQIALIRQYLEKHLPDMLPLITVDTVERYQGGARDIIIISMCINKLSQLDNMVSLSQEGVDRKLNVALTRAKEQIVIIGNEDLLSNNVMYNKLINSYHKLDYYYLNTPLTVES
ncbi:MAG TPA: C-terminal helicase domain-containing protein [Saprospiraceae bacterium]|nr:C-terminal helicase domain-containing protein [Saprospiraceae bacterium]